MASQKELRALITLAGKIDPSLQTALMKASKLSSNVSNNAKKSASSLSKVGQIAKGVFIGNLITRGAERIGEGLLDAAKSGIKLASDLSEVQNVVDVTFGSNSNKISTWAKTAGSSFGLSELQADKFSGTLGSMLKASGITGNQLVTMSKKLTALSGDIASFDNLSVDEAFQKLQSGIAGQTEPLRSLGIDMTETNMQAYALSKGITTSYKDMDQASKTSLRYSYIMAMTKDKQGDFQRTSGSFANQVRQLDVNFGTLSANVMSKVVPSLASGLKWVNGFITSFSPEDISNFTDKVGEYLGKASDSVKYLYDRGVELYGYMSDNWPKIEPIAYGIAGGIIAFKLATEGLVLAQKGAMIIEGLTTAWSVATGIIEVVRGGTSLWTIAQWELNAAMDANPVGLVCVGIGALIAIGVELYNNWETITTTVSNAWSKFREFINGAPDLVLALSGPLAPLLLLIKHFEQLKDLASSAFNAVKNFLGLGSSASSASVDTSATVGMTKYATGGIASTPSIFGDDGPEMAIPLKRTSRNLGLLSQTAQILGVSTDNSNSGTFIKPDVKIDIAINAPSGDSNSIAQTAKAAVIDAMDQYFGDKARMSFNN